MSVGMKIHRIGFMILAAAMATSATSIGQAQSAAEKAQAEWNRMKEMTETLTAPEYVGRNPDADLVAVGNLASYREHMENVAKEFAAEIKDDNQPFRNLGYMLGHMETALTGFERAAREYGSLQAIQGDLEHVLTMAKRAVENEAPAYFRPENDICRSTQSAKTRIRYLQSFSPGSEDLKSAIGQFEQTILQVREIEQSLSDGILKQNELPPDEYQADDREALLKLLRDKWTKEGTAAEVLRVGIVAPEWNRSVTWEIQNRTLYKVDQSRIQGYVIVKHNDQVAARHSINLIKDHLSNDKLSAGFLNDPKADPELNSQILLTKIQ